MVYVYIKALVVSVLALFLCAWDCFTCVVKQLVPYKYRTKKDVKDRKILITGSGSGLGRLTAIKFAKLGAHIILVDIDEKNNKGTYDEIVSGGGKADIFKCDLSDREQIYAVSKQIKEKCGRVYMLVQNAGIVTGKKFLDSPDKLIDLTFAVNATAHFWLSKEFLPDMLEHNDGHIVTIASMAGYFGTAGLCDYCSSKFAAVGFEESMRNELVRLNKTGVKTTVVCPYYISTGMFEGVNSLIIPFLTPDYVTDKIVEAALTNQEVLMLPRVMYFLNFLKGFLSVSTMKFIGQHGFKLFEQMDNFVGRNGNKKDN